MRPSEIRTGFRVSGLRWWLVLVAILGVLGLDHRSESEVCNPASYSDEAGDDQLPPEQEFLTAPTKALCRPRAILRSVRLIGAAVDAYPRRFQALLGHRSAAANFSALPGFIASALLRC
jgi:hypothetical protein